MENKNKNTEHLISLLEYFTKQKVVLKEFDIVEDDGAGDAFITMYDEITILVDNCKAEIIKKLTDYNNEFGTVDKSDLLKLVRLFNRYSKAIRNNIIKSGRGYGHTVRG